MARLSEKEANMLKQLQAKAEAPDEPTMARSISVSIDLSDDKQVQRAQKWGFLPSDDDDGDDDDSTTDDADTDDTPKRRGYFE